MLIPMGLSELDDEQEEFIPQAIIGMSIHELPEAEVVRGADDFDQYEGAAWVLLPDDERYRDRDLDSEILVVAKHYRGHPPATVTLYLPGSIRGVEKITSVIKLIERDFRLPPKSIVWQRKDNPEL